MHTCIHPYIRTYTHAHVRTLTHTHTYIHTYIHTHTHIYIQAFIHTYIHTHIYTYRHAYIHTYTHVCMHARAHAHTHTYMHAHVRTYIQTHTHIEDHLNIQNATSAWLRWLVAGLSLRRLGFASGSVHVGFVVDILALGQVFLRVLWFSLVIIIPPWLSILKYHLGDEQKARWRLQFRDTVSPVDMTT
jgi:hypothetical protein